MSKIKLLFIVISLGLATVSLSALKELTPYGGASRYIRHIEVQRSLDSTYALIDANSSAVIEPISGSWWDIFIKGQGQVKIRYTSSLPIRELTTKELESRDTYLSLFKSRELHQVTQEQVVSVVKSSRIFGTWSVPAGLDQKTLVTSRISAYATPSPYSEITLIKDYGVYSDKSDYGALKNLRTSVIYLVRSLLLGTCILLFMAVLISDTPHKLNKSLFITPSIIIIFEILAPSGIFASISHNFIVVAIGPWI